MGRYHDHFHAYWRREGRKGETEGGWTGVPEGWDSMTREEQDLYLKHVAIEWGMPKDAELIAFHLAG